MKYILVVLLGFILCLAGCASEHKASGSGSSSASYGLLYEAAKQSAPENNFKITSADLATGHISAEHGSGKGWELLDITVLKGSPNTVKLYVEAAPGTKGKARAALQDIIKSIKSRVLDFKLAK